MKVDIQLDKSGRSTLVKLCRRLFGHFHYVKVVKHDVILKKRWYSREKTRMQVVDLVLLHIPDAINELYVEYECGKPFEKNDDLHSAVEYFGVRAVGTNILDMLEYQLDNLDMSMQLLDEYQEQPALLEKQEVEIEESHTVSKVFEEAFDYFYNLITDVITKVHPKKTIYMNTESACNSPPIRAPGLKVA